MEKNTIPSSKRAINLKSVKLKTEDTFHTIFIWLITSNLNLLLRCHWRVVLFLVAASSLSLFLYHFFPPLSSYSFSLPSHSPAHPDSLFILRRNKFITTMFPKSTFTVQSQHHVSTCMLEQN